MTAQPEPARPRPAVDAVAGLLASCAIFLGVIAVFYRPARVAPAAVILALLAATMSARWSRLAGIGALAGGLGWLVGMAIAVATNHPIW